VQTCRRERLDRTLIFWNQHHLLHALREFERFYNGHRPHHGIANARPLRPLPPPIIDLDQIARWSQPVEAIELRLSPGLSARRSSANTSAGVLNPSIARGRSFISSATA